MFNTKNFVDWLKSISSQLVEHNHRAAFVLSGDKQYYQQLLDNYFSQEKIFSSVYLSLNIPQAILPAKASTLLGREYDAVIFDACNDFDIDAFAAITGTLCGGGMLFILIPAIDQWKELQKSRFLQRALPLLTGDDSVYFIEQNKALPEIRASMARQNVPDRVEYPFRTLDQAHAVTAIVETVIEQKNNPLVLISDRGRGKSASLGLAAGMLIAEGIKNIVITAPRLSVSDTVFYHAEQLLDGVTARRGLLTKNNSELKFVAPDALLIEQPEADVLFVDEAAAIPLPMLEKFLYQYPCVVYSTTIHGYEGTGRGFEIKFRKMLDQYKPGWQQINLGSPVRWGIDDPVEQWCDKLLCLHAELSFVSAYSAIKKEQCQFELIERDQLVTDESSLESIFSLLVYAHYQTRPSDLKYLLDSENVRLYVLQYQGVVIAVLLINQEGNLDAELTADIYKGHRRPRGDLLPQTLTFHSGCEHAAQYSYARIMRIAVHPDLQNQGLGSYLVSRVIEQEQTQVDAIGTSFASSPGLISFWKKLGFEIVRMGFSRDHASGAHSAVMLLPFSTGGENVYRLVRNRFRQSLNYWLSDVLSNLDDEMTRLLSLDAIQDNGLVTDEDWKDIRSFVSMYRGYDACVLSIKRILTNCASWAYGLDENEQKIIEIKVMCNQSWTDVVEKLSLSGKAEAIRLLRQTIGKIINKCVNCRLSG